MKLKESVLLRKLQEEYYSKTISPWGVELNNNPFKGWRETELKDRNIGLFFKNITGSNKEELQNNNGLYFNIVCPKIIFELERIIKDAAPSKYSIVKPLDVVWGTLPVYEVNARSIKIDLEYIITINESVLYLLYEVYRLIWLILYDNSGEGKKEGVISTFIHKDKFNAINKIYLNDFIELLSSFLLTGITTSSRKGLPANNLMNNIAAHTFDVSIFYIFCHEYGHIVFNHHNEAAGNEKDQELQADAFAAIYSLVFNAAKNYHYTFGVLSIELFFAFNKFLTQMITKSTEKHPEIEQRRINAMEGFIHSIGNKNRKEVESVKIFGDSILELLQYIWQETSGQILKNFETEIDKRFISSKPNNTNFLSKILSVFTIWSKNKPTNAIEELFKRCEPFVKYILLPIDENVRVQQIKLIVNNRFTREEIGHIVSYIAFRIQFSTEKKEEEIVNIAYTSLSNKMNISRNETAQIYNYMQAEYIEFIKVGKL